MHKESCHESINQRTTTDLHCQYSTINCKSLSLFSSTTRVHDSVATAQSRTTNHKKAKWKDGNFIQFLHLHTFPKIASRPSIGDTVVAWIQFSAVIKERVVNQVNLVVSCEVVIFCVTVQRDCAQKLAKFILRVAASRSL